MSFWLKCGVKIEDLQCFIDSCKKNHIDIQMEKEGSAREFRGSPVIAVFSDKQGTGHGYLIRQDGAIQMAMDTDANYNTIIRRLGKNGGRLGRDYTEMVIRKEARKVGGMISKTRELPDGSLIIRAMVAA